MSSFNAFLLRLHRWTGIVFALVFVVVALSGSLLTFRFEIQQAMHPELRPLASDAGEETPDFVAIAARLADEVEGAELLFLQRNPAQPSFPIRAVYTHPEDGFKVIYAHQQTGALIKADINDPFWRWMRELHIFLVQGMPGLFLVFVSGWVLMLCSALGLWLWVPRLLKKPKVALGIRWRAGLRKLLLDLHNATGVYLLVPIMLLALTGVTLILARIDPSELPEPDPEVLAMSGVPVAEALERALDTVPSVSVDVVVRQIQMPREDAPWFRIDYSGGEGAGVIFVDAGGERQILGYSERKLSLWKRLKAELGVAIHEGYIAGDIGKLIVFISGITLTTGSVTGIWLWLVARRQKKRPRLSLTTSSSFSHQPAE